MNHSGSLPPGQSGFPGQPHPQQQQHFTGYQQGHPQQHFQHQHQHQQPNQQYGFPSQELGGFGGYDAGFGQTAQPQPQPQLQAQNQWAYYNTGNGYGGGNGGMQMPPQEQYMAPQGVWQHQQRQAQAQRPQQQVHQQQQSYHMPSPQMQHAMNTQAHYGNQGPNPYQHQVQGQQQMGHLQQPPRRSPSISQQHQQMHQRPSPQVQHQPSPHMQQQQFALHSPVQQQQGYQQMHPQQQAHGGHMHGQPQQQQQTQPSPRVPSQQPQTHTPPLQQKKPQVLQPQARSDQPHPHPHPQAQPQPQPQVQPEVKPKPEFAQTSFQGQPQSQGQARPQVPNQSQNQTRHVPSPQPQLQPQTQPSAGFQASLPPTTASPSLQDQPPQQTLASTIEQAQFVNLQDIQAMPRPKPTPAAPAPQSASSSKQGSLQPPAPIKKSNSPSGTPRLSNVAPSSKVKVEKSGRSSVSQSPGTPSGRLSTSQSPAMPTKKSPTSNASVLAAAAEELIDKARSASLAIAGNPQSAQVDEYQKMIATGLACFEAALQGKRLTPRQEARVRLRYAAVLHEETENISEAETTLSKGIILCDKHRLHDLKYCMQYLMMKVLFQRNRKAGLKALDQHIADCDTYQHVHWAYAFRLLKASFYEESGNAADATSFENMRAIQSMASARGDVAMSVYAYLSEALIMLKTSKGNQEAVHNCLAQASKYQFDEQAKIPQLELMSLLLDVAVGLHRDSHDVLGERLRELKKRIGNHEGVSSHGDFLMPIQRPSSGSHTISSETSTIIQPGNPEASDKDHLVMKFITQPEMAVIVFSLCGLNYLHKQHLAQHNTATLWQEGLKVLKHYGNTVATTNKPAIVPLKSAIEQRNWRMRTQSYLNMLLGLLATSHCEWHAVRESLAAVEEASREGLEGSLKAYYYYLKGAYCQGTGELQSALSYFQDESLSLSKKQNTSAAQQHLALLAGINRIWIMQRPEGAHDWPYENHALTRELIDELNPLCSEHYVQEIRVAWWVVGCSAVQNPPIQRNVRKDAANRALHTSRSSENVFGKLISILGARDLLFTNVLGEQAMKSINVAGAFSKKSNSPLWQSVVAGIYADFSETKNEREEAQKWFDYGSKASQAAFQRNS